MHAVADTGRGGGGGGGGGGEFDSMEVGTILLSTTFHTHKNLLDHSYVTPLSVTKCNLVTKLSDVLGILHHNSMS